MWLINTSSLELQQIIDSAQEAYAILSHTWGDAEVTFQQLSQTASRSEEGFAKIKKTCNLAKRQGIRWAWVDTCCIDKTSSAELSESINSMFTWYHHSEVCFVYLADLKPIPTGLSSADRGAYLDKELPQCRWFTRGWTLQELIAAKNLMVYDQEWNFVGTKSDLEDRLSRITKIDAAVLRDSLRLRAVPVARRMSWASARQTTRKEDVAYCLLGIFDINMPLLYGEGEKAFQRLQEAIATEMADLSLFAWQSESTAGNKDKEIRKEPGYISPALRLGGIFASSPRDFQHCANLRRPLDARDNFTVTGNGILVSNINLYRLRNFNPQDVFHGYFLLGLNCCEISERTNGKARWLSIYVMGNGRDYIRVIPDKVATHDARTLWAKTWKESRGGEKSVLIRKTLPLGGQVRIEASTNSKVSILWRGSYPSEIKCLELIGSPFSLFEGTCHDEISIAIHNDNYKNIIGMVNLHLAIDVADEDLIYPTGRPQDASVRNWTDQKGTVHCVIVCGLQWKDDHLEPWAAIYVEHDTLSNIYTHRNMFSKSSTHVTKEIICHVRESEDVVDHRPLKAVEDIMLREYSDISGYMLQEAMPRWVGLTSERTGRTWVLSLTPEAEANAGAPKKMDVTEKNLKDGVIWLECHEV